MTSPVVDISAPQRQSPLAAIFLVIKAVRSIGIVQIVFGIGFVFSQSRSILLIAIGAAIIGLVLLLIALLSWWRYTFVLQDGELRVESGILSRNRLTLPLDRIQSVSIEQKFLHRIVGLVEVTADTAGGATAEFNLSAVKRPVAEAVQAAAADHRSTNQAVATPDAVVLGPDGQETLVSTPPAPTQPERVLIKRTPREIIKIAFTTVPIYGLAVIAPLFAVGLELADNLPFDLPTISVDFGRQLLWLVPIVILAFVVVGLTLNTIAALLKEWNLTITQTASGLRRDAGLLSKSSTASSIPRIQLIRESQNVAERWAGIRSLQLVGVSSVSFSGSGGVTAGGTIAIDGCSQDEVDELRTIVFDGSRPVTDLDQRVSQLEIYKQTRNTSLIVVPLAIGLIWTPIGFWSLFFLAVIPLTWWQVRRATNRRRWGINNDSIADRHGLFGYNSTEALLRKTNSATVRQSLFERKRDLATVRIDLANGHVSIGMIPLEQARQVRDRAIYVAETDTRAFM